MLGGLVRLRAVLGLGIVHLRRSPGRTTLAVLGIALAVLGTTLLASVGYGAVETGTQKFESSDRDLWLTGGPLQIQPQAQTPIQNTVTDAHMVATRLKQHEGVNSATPIAFHAAYVGRNTSNLRLLTGVGVTKATPGSISLDAGRGFREGDVHYANGTYTGSMTREAIIDPRTAALFDVGVGETLYIGGSTTSAREHAFTVVGISPTFSRFLGTPTVVIHLSELQTLTGTTGTDRASFITIRLHEDTDPTAVQKDLQQQFPRYEIRTSRQQLQSILKQNAVILASGVVLVVLAIVAGIALIVNLLALVVFQQRRELAALRAIGLSKWTLMGLVGSQGVVLGGLGGILGIVMTPVAVLGLNHLAAQLVGFESLLSTPLWIYLVGAGIALGIGTVGAVMAGWQIARMRPLEELH